MKRFTLASIRVISAAVLAGAVILVSQTAFLAAPLGSSSLPDLTHLSGYAYDPDLGNLPSEVHIYIDNVLFDSTIADFSLPSLVSQGITPNPEHAFFSLLPSNLSPGDHTIKVTTLDEPEHTEVELIGSPHIIHVPDPNGNPPPQGGGGGGGGAADLSPDPFIISPITDVRVSTQVISNANTLTGFAESLNIIITANNQNPNVQGGSTTTILKNGVDTGSTAVLVSPGDAVSFKTKSSPTLNTQITLDITLGTYTTQWSVTTALLPPAANPQCTEGSQTFTSPGTSDYTILAPGCTGITIETQGAGKNPKISTFTGAIPPTSPTYSVTVGSTAAPISSVKYQSTTLTTSSGGTPDPLFQNGKVTISWKGSPQFQSSPQNVTQLLQRVTPPAPPAPVPPQLALPTIIYHHPDHLTSTSIDTDQTGTITQLNDYYPFGSTRISTTTGDYHNDYLYTGKEQDDATNLMYYGARYYDATTGRFLSIDPSALMNPENLIQDPQALNTYAYARNNPLIYLDPTGEDFLSFFLKEVIGLNTAYAPESQEDLIQLQNQEAQEYSQDKENYGAPVFLMSLISPSGKIGKEVAHGIDNVALSALKKAGNTNVFRSFTQNNFRDNLSRLTGKIPDNAQAHHIFPQKFEKQFSQIGIDIHDPKFGSWVDTKSHQSWSKEYNDKWNQFFKDVGSENLPSQQVSEKAASFGKELSEKYNFNTNY